MSQEQKKPEVALTHKYELRPSPEMKGVQVLFKDSNPCKCHKAGNPMLIPSALSNQLELKYEFCSTNCPRALVGVEEEKVVYIQTCEVQTMKFRIDNAVRIENEGVNKPKLEIIK